MAALTFIAFFSLKWDIMGTLKKMGTFWGPKFWKGSSNGDPFGSSGCGVVWLMIWVFGCCGFIGYYGFRWCGDRRITIFPEGRDFAPRGHTCKKRGIVGIYPRKFFWIFRKILGWEREINSAQLEMENAWLLIPSSWRLLEILFSNHPEINSDTLEIQFFVTFFCQFSRFTHF